MTLGNDAVPLPGLLWRHVSFQTDEAAVRRDSLGKKRQRTDKTWVNESNTCYELIQIGKPRKLRVEIESRHENFVAHFG